MARKVFLGTVLISLFSSLCAAGFFQNSSNLDILPAYREEYLLVRFLETRTGSSASAVRASVVQSAGGGTIQEMYDLVPGLALVKLPAGTSVSEARVLFQATPGVQYAVPDYIRQPMRIPNDTYFSQMWGLNNTGQTGGLADADIDAPEAWNLVTGSQETLVGVIDTGVDYTHEDLAGNMWVNTAELNGTAGVDDDGNGYVDDINGYDFGEGDSDPTDEYGHGTHVSGTIGAVGNNNTGIVGVNWNVRIMALKASVVIVVDNVEYTVLPDSATIAALNYAVQMGAKVTNNSYGGYGENPAFYDALVASQQAGLLFVAAAGNEYNDNDITPAYPASYNLSSIISVAATDDMDQKADFSNWGRTTVDIGAPGVDILSTVPLLLDDDGNANGYASYQGTSMASPHVAGACALIWSMAPNLTAAEVKQVLLGSVDPLDSLGNLCVSQGRLNLYKALSSIQIEDTIAPTPDPAQWSIVPTAAGLRYILMEAEQAIDPAGVEYFFDCVYAGTGNKDDYDSDWQDAPLYILGDEQAERDLMQEGTTYTFRCMVRDKSDNHNGTGWSEEKQTTTASGSNTLPPVPSPSRWKAMPRAISNSRIGMELYKSYNENGVEYFFDCVFASTGNEDAYDSGWLTVPYYFTANISGGIAGKEFTFVAYARQAGTTDPLYVTEPAPASTVGYTTIPMTRQVPSAAYPTIQSAVDAARSGDTVLVHQGIYRENNILVLGKAITIRSEDPQDPVVVASTVIDCEDIWDLWVHEERRAFLLGYVGRDTVLAGFTIQNATAIDDPATRIGYPNAQGDPDRGNRYPNLSFLDGTDAQGGAILCLGSPTIRYCNFINCSAEGNYGRHGQSGRDGLDDMPGGHADRGGNGGNGYGGAIYAFSGSAPLIQGCRFEDCRAIGGDAGNGGNGGNGGGHSDGVEQSFGHRGGDGGDGGLGGCAWGGAMYFEPNCMPDLLDVTVTNCLVQVGEGGMGGNGGNGSDAESVGNGGDGGNGGMGGDLMAPDSSGGAVYYGNNCRVTIERCTFENCRVVAELQGDYSGGNGGNGGNFAGDNDTGTVGGNGGHGGPAVFIPDKMYELGTVVDETGAVITEGVRATGGTGGNAGGGGGRQGFGGNGGFRMGLPGNGRYNTTGQNWAFLPQQTGIWPSNIYYLSYYWENADRPHLDNPVPPFSGSEDPWYNYIVLPNFASVDSSSSMNEDIAFNYDWSIDTYVYEPNATLTARVSTIFYSAYTPFYGINNYRLRIVPTPIGDPNAADFPDYWDYNRPIRATLHKISENRLTPDTTVQPNSGACAGANFYGENCILTMKDTTISDNVSYANHAGGELYDKGCRALFENCTFEENVTWITPLNQTDYRLEGLGGGIFADQPKNLEFRDCTFVNNVAYSGGGLYCNFAPSTGIEDPNLSLTDCTFSGNLADYHFTYSYAGGLYAGNSLDPYEEVYFNKFAFIDDFVTYQYIDHGYIDFYYTVPTTLWGDMREVDHILWGAQPPYYTVSMTGCGFEENLSASGGGFYLDASVVHISDSPFSGNTGQVGAGGVVYASDLTAENNLFAGNIGSEIISRGIQSELDNGSTQGVGSAAGLYISDSDVFLSTNRFVDNEVDGYAGALILVGPPLTWDTPQRVTNNLFVQNTSGLGGGAVKAEWSSDVSILNCTFVDNTVTDTTSGSGGAVMAHDTFMDVTNSIFRGNLAVLGPQIAVGDPHDDFYIPYTTVFVDYSNVQGGENQIFVAAGTEPWLWYGENNLDTDPLFVDFGTSLVPESRTFYLSHTAIGQAEDSPCIDTGLGSAASLASLVGFPVTTRTDNEADSGTVDMGYHYNADPINRTYYTFQASVFVADLEPMGTIKAAWIEGGVPQELGPALTLPPTSVIQGTVIQLEAVSDDPALYRVKQWTGTDNDLLTASANTVTMMADKIVTVEFESAISKNITVPSQVETVAEAIAVARDGDTIVLAPRPGEPYYIDFVDTDLDGVGEGLDLQGKSVIITSEDPDDPLVVASTIIDCGGTRYTPSRGFVFRNGEGPDTVIQGVTIRNGYMVGALGLNAEIENGPYPPIDQTPPPPNRANTGTDATGDGYGGAILCENGSSPTIRNCVFERCVVTGGYGGDGADGRLAFEGADAPGEDGQSGGHGGNGFGLGYGGAIACRTGSSPTIEGCTFRNNTAMGGCGGRGGNGSDAEGNGKGSWGGYGGNASGNGIGGSLFVDSGCQPTIDNCTFEDNTAQHGLPGTGGSAGSGNAYSEPWDQFYAGSDGIIIVYATQPLEGGAVKFGNNTQNALTNSTFTRNRAFENSYEIYADMIMPAVQRLYTNGGAVSVGSGIGSTLTMHDCTFEENMAGAVWCGDYTAVEVIGCEFKANGAYDKIPGIDLYAEYNAYLQLVLDPFQESPDIETFGEAGAIVIGKHAPSAVIEQSRFFNNYTLGSGGAIRCDSNLTMTDCTFGGNESSRGGAVDLYYDVTEQDPKQTLLMDMTGCSFAENSAYLTGGGLFARSGQITANECWFISNKARSGGGFYLTEGQMEIGNTLFTLNTATGIIRGYQTITGEGQGGAVACMNAGGDIWDSRFISNRAEGGTGQGGAINFTNGDLLLTHAVTNCLFENNQAQQAGGAITAKVGSSPKIEFCTFLDNKVNDLDTGIGGALYITSDGTASLNHTIVTGSNGMAVYEAAPLDSLVESCLFYSNPNGDYSGTLPAETIKNNPMLETGPLGSGYLNQTSSPAIDAGSKSAVEAGLNQFTTDPADTAADTGLVDLGYHFPFASGLATYTVTAYVENGKGTVTIDPSSGPYYKGQIVDLTTQVNEGYLITGWSDTLDDGSTESSNRVLIDGDKTVIVHVRLPDYLYVGGSAAYNSLAEAVSDAKDGDIIIVNPGLYQSTTTTNLNFEAWLTFDGKNLKIRGSNPEDPETVQNTILDHFGIFLMGLGPDTSIEGITLRQSLMWMVRSNITIRNCRFVSCNWSGGMGVTPEGCAQDGVNGGMISGAAVDMTESSPHFIGCLFEGNSTFGGTGTDARNGCDGHPDGGDGGWPGWAYGGAVACQFSSNPVFENCTFRDNFVLGGTGGRGGNGNTNTPYLGYAGLGGGWNYSDQIEIGYLILRGWDGWQNGNKYTASASSQSSVTSFFEMYDWEDFARWFEFDTEKYQSWNDLLVYYQFDPYDSFYSYWRYGGYGGAVFCAYDSNAQFTGCTFEGNSSSGGLTGLGGTSAFAGDVPEPDRALNIPNAGGAVYAMFDCNLEFTDCIISGNTASTDVEELPHTIHVGFGGGVAYQYDCTAKFTNCIIEDNLASDGGGIYANESMTTIQDCNVADNTAYLGAGFFQIQDQAHVENVQFRRNQAASPSFDPPVETTSLGQGGGFYAGSVGVNLRDAVFAENTADFSGGGLFMTNVNSLGSTFKNCLFAQNRSGRDGGGASIYWGANPSISNCTFADNYVSGRPGYMAGSGGGLYIGYNTTVEMTDSILWLNYALQGAQATVGSGFDADPYPSVLNLSYSDVLNINTSGNAIYARSPSLLNKIVGIQDDDPLFEGPVDPTRIVLPEENYYLNPASPGIDTGSDLARNVDMDGYTTQLTGALDRDQVDLGYHYFVVRRSECAKIDNALVLSGVIDLADLVDLIFEQWLSQDCGAPGWCEGSDLNFDTAVDLWDMAMMSGCWLASDQTPPIPDPMRWDLPPAVLPVTTLEGEPNPDYRIDKITMTAALAHDTWWPDSEVDYWFECTTYPSLSAWRSVPAYSPVGLIPGVQHDFLVYARDGSGNITQPSPTASVIPGNNYDGLLPDPSQFEIIPGGTGPTSISMTAEQVTGIPDLPAPLAGKGTFHVEYCFEKVNILGELLNLPPGQNPYKQQNYSLTTTDQDAFYSETPWKFTDTGLILGQTYYYRAFTRLIFRETSGTTHPVSRTASTAIFAANTVEIDDIIPVPSPAQWEVWPSHLLYDTWYHYMRAVVASDDSGVEYKFVCVTFPGLSSDWQNVDNVGGIVDPDFSARLPNEYWVPVYVSTAYYDYYILVQDRSPNQNPTAASSTCTAGQNAETCPNLLIVPPAP